MKICSCNSSNSFSCELCGYSFSYIDGVVTKSTNSGLRLEVPLDEATDEFLLEALSYFHRTDFDPYQEPHKSVREHFLDYCSGW